MPNGVNIKLNSDLIRLLDERRGDLNRDEFIIRILHDHLKKVNTGDDSEMEFMELESEPEVNERFLRKFMKDFQEFTDNINIRLERLEGLVSDTTIQNGIDEVEDEDEDLEEYSDTDEEIYDDKKSYSVKDQNGEPMIFELVESEEDSFEPEDTEGRYYSKKAIGDDFEYGCPYCNATISSDATFCPKCGNRFDESIDRYEPTQDAVIVEPLSEGYSGTGEYDPRPRYMKKSRAPEFDRGESPRWQEPREVPKPSSVPTISKVELCTICGDKLTYLKDYKRWYCYRCKRYEGAPAQPPRDFSPPRSTFEASPQDKFARKEGAPLRSPPPGESPEMEDRTQRRVFQKKGKPLRDYPKYVD